MICLVVCLPWRREESVNSSYNMIWVAICITIIMKNVMQQHSLYIIHLFLTIYRVAYESCTEHKGQALDSAFSLHNGLRCKSVGNSSSLGMNCEHVRHEYPKFQIPEEPQPQLSLDADMPQCRPVVGFIDFCRLSFDRSFSSMLWHGRESSNWKWWPISQPLRHDLTFLLTVTTSLQIHCWWLESGLFFVRLLIL